MAKTVTHLVFRHLDSRRAPCAKDGDFEPLKFDGPSLYGITEQAPEVGAGITGLVSGADAVELYASLDPDKPGKPTPYRAGISAELIAYHAGLGSHQAQHVADLAPVHRGPLEKRAMKEIKARIGDADRVALEDAIIGYMCDPAQIQDPTTETPAQVGARYAAHVANRTQAMLDQLEDGQHGVIISAAHEPCVTALRMHVMEQPYDAQAFGGSIQTAQFQTFAVTQQPGGLAVASYQFRDSQRELPLQDLVR